jgi:hypothetical protein
VSDDIAEQAKAKKQQRLWVQMTSTLLQPQVSPTVGNSFRTTTEIQLGHRVFGHKNCRVPNLHLLLAQDAASASSPHLVVLFNLV